MRGGRENLRFLANTSLYLRNGARYRPRLLLITIWSRTRAFDWTDSNDLGWPWTLT